MKQKLTALRGSLYFNVIGGLVTQMLLFGFILLVIANSICVNAFKREHSDTTYRMADAASALVEGDYIPLFLEGNNMLEYGRTQRELDLCCDRLYVSLIYVISVDQTDYGRFVNVLNSVNNKVDDTSYTRWELGYRRNTTNDEYRQKYKALYEDGSEYETVYRMHPTDGSKPHITTMVPIRDHTDNVVALLCVQRPVSELIETMQPYIIIIIGCTLVLVTLFNLFVSLFINRSIIRPVNKVSREATRFAKENTKGEPLGKISRYHVFSELSVSIDDMETELTEYMENLTAATTEKERISAELDIAKKIQTAMIPSEFPPFPDRQEFEIYGSMTPAKEVGGDFYNFFLIDSDHLALVVADVSGKGIPAALFMMATSILIRENVSTDITPAEALTVVNQKLCNSNKADMFVTVWLGFLEISTGRLICANAGHEDPAVCRKNGTFELMKSRHGLMLGTIENVRYRDVTYTLNGGDKLFLYTDGVPEAKNSEGARFRLSGMKDALDQYRNGSPQEILEGVHRRVDAFVGQAPQFDDLTMLCVEIKEKAVTKTLVTDASPDKLGEVKDFVNGILEGLGCPKKTRKKIDLSVEEIFVNIARYAYGGEAGTAEITVNGDAAGVTIVFSDSGIPYDPLAKRDPDLSLSAEDRQIGGLGVYLVKKNMDETSYRYQDGRNVLTIKKHF